MKEKREAENGKIRRLGSLMEALLYGGHDVVYVLALHPHNSLKKITPEVSQLE